MTFIIPSVCIFLKENQGTILTCNLQYANEVCNTTPHATELYATEHATHVDVHPTVPEQRCDRFQILQSTRIFILKYT